jgi:ABC-type antimicrobial peptide transport system permease subunit
VQIGDTVTGVYSNKFEGALTANVYKIAAVYNPGKVLPDNVILVSENNFYHGYLRNLPADVSNYKGSYTPSTNNVLMPVLATEWRLLPRTATSDELIKKIRNTMKENWEGSYYDVSTMYEAASFLIDMQRGLDIISLVAVMILFFVILIGVLNTLRMTIRERTREIGTIRSIGMQKEDVRTTFILETFYLTLFGCLAGIILGIIILNLFALIKIETDSMFGMLLLDKHINFVLFLGRIVNIIILFSILALEVIVISFDRHIPRWIVSALLVIFILLGFIMSGSGSGILTFLILIINMLIAIAYFPARRAAEMSAASALRQYE